MYLMSENMYECDICGLREKVGAHDDHRGDIWECENCMKDFCTDCFMKRLGSDAFHRMLGNTDFVVCPDCFEKNAMNVKEDAYNERRSVQDSAAHENG